MPDTAPVRYAVVPSPIGALLLLGDGEALTGLYMEERRWRVDVDPAWTHDERGDIPVLRAAREQLDAYFAGARTTFDLPLAPAGTDFQRRVWEALRAIPFGEIVSYTEIARRVGSPSAVRAVGAANGRNPISIVVPCHRVLGADGSLTGFGGGLERKRWLLDHETRVRLAGGLIAEG